MRKLICLTLILSLLAAPALAQPLLLGETLKEGDFNLTLRTAGVTDEWNKQTSQTHAWIVLDVTAQTFDTNPMDLSGALSATLTYQGKYAYDAALEFETNELEPLVALPGKLVFRVPLLVAEADPSELEYVLTCAGTKHPVSLRYAPAADGDLANIFFDQPEDAILFFIDHIAQGDFMGALSASAAGSVAKDYQMAPLVERLQSVAWSMVMPLPSNYPNYVMLNRLGALDSLWRQSVGLIVSLLINPEMVDGKLRILKDGLFDVTENQTMSIDEYIALLDPAQLKALNVQAIYLLDSDLYHSESNQESLQRSSAIYGNTTSKEFLMIYEFNGRLYQHTCKMVQYEKGWQIGALYSSLLNANPYGGASFITEDEIQTLVASGDYVKVYPKA
jgi:hypothetical protein